MMAPPAINDSAPRLRLAPQVLMPGETISSLVDRQASLWGVSRIDLMNQVDPPSALGRRDVDVRLPLDKFLDHYATKIGQTSAALSGALAHYGSHIVFMSYRNAYCPICFFEDAASGYTPYFRLDWARVFLTHCRQHGCPLFPWPKTAPSGFRRLPHQWFMGQGPALDDCPQFMQDLTLAKMYAYGIRPKTPPSIDAWRRVCHFEEWLYQRSVGALQICEQRRGVSSLEQEVVHRAAALAQSTRLHGRLKLEGRDGSFEEPRVMTFVMDVGKERADRWLELRGFRSIAKRRALMYATSFDFMDV
ncbi:TniQ family protein [Dyella acidisoli]|uniref:TniQ domain-containing protein n=1 Tax=Dyella acidisoli TaxID=1867834 RepID=A0ABQ5XLL1_9GAMM|nr:TniQ family protein [Dyella acidisoli]GLQ91988.1 hypothetical protein GCM10007901_09390 [Dyella acidisoli]